MFEMLSSHISLQILFSINLWLCIIVGLYHMQTRSNDALVYFLSYGVIMSIVSIVDYAGYTDLAFKLCVLATVNFVGAVLFITVRLIKANLKRPKHIANSN